MNILPIVLGVLSGVCFGTGVIFLFTGLRRSGGDRLQILFAVFAFGYSGAILTGLLNYETTTLDTYMQISRWGSFFTIHTLIFLLWFVAYYTDVRPRIFLLSLTLILAIVGIVAIFRANFIHEEILGLVRVTLPWGETIAFIDATESIWEIIFFVSEVTLIGYFIYASIRQFILGERRAALALGIGLLFLMLALIFDILFIDSGVLNFVYLGDFGFFPLLIVMSLRLSNEVIRTENKLALYRFKLEELVKERTYELQKTNNQLSEQINERERIQGALSLSEHTARTMLDASKDSTMLINTDGIIVDLNEFAAEKLGLNIFDAKGINIYSLLSSTSVEYRREKITTLLRTRKPIQWEEERSGRKFNLHLYPILDDSRNVVNVAVYEIDITDQINVATLEERSRLARDLHDAVTQTIYSASLIAEVLPKVWDRNPEEGKRNLGKLRQLVRGALAEMRTLLFELRPASLEAAELDTLLGQLGDSLTGRTQILVQVEVDPEIAVSTEKKVAIYRICQEAINNIIKHSEATQARIVFNAEDEEFCLEIWDDGRGFNPQQTAPDCMGLQIMAERAKSIGASFTVKSQPGNGTLVRVIWQADPSLHSG